TLLLFSLYFFIINILCSIISAFLSRFGLISTALLCVGLGFVHFFRCVFPCLIDFIQSRLNGVYIFSFVCFFQFVQSTFDVGLIVVRQFIAKLFQLFLCLENHCVSFVQFVCGFLGFFVRFGISFRFFFHSFDFFISQSGRGFDADIM